MSEIQRLAEIAGFYQDVFAQLAQHRPAAEIVVEFYAYVGLNHTIRVRGGRVLVRLSDLTRAAPDEVHQALAVILVSKLINKPVSQLAVQTYQAYAAQPQTAQAARTRRQTAGRKFISGPQGRFYNLERLFHKLNRRYFAGAVPQPTLSWSQHEARRIVGHHDATHDAIVISRALDAPDVPDWVVEFVLYHEMLHIKHPPRHSNGRRYVHTAAFRADEKRFPHYEAAETWLKQAAMTGQKTIVRRAARRVRKT